MTILFGLPKGTVNTVDANYWNHAKHWEGSKLDGSEGKFYPRGKAYQAMERRELDARASKKPATKIAQAEAVSNVKYLMVNHTDMTYRIVDKYTSSKGWTCMASTKNKAKWNLDRFENMLNLMKEDRYTQLN